MPRVIIIGGPNGAGKTTFASEFLPNEAECVQFVNADLIAWGFAPFTPVSADVEARRAMIKRVDELAGRGVDFAIESTLSGRWLVRRIPKWQYHGYSVELHYLKLANVSIAIERVRNRVIEGGHDVSSAIIRRRFDRGLKMFDNTYKLLVDKWVMYDNSGTQPLILDAGAKSK